ncbi:MAG: DUF2771 domain-containing protein [Mycobacterium sp.]
MKRIVAMLAAVALVATAGTGVLIWRMSRSHGPGLPQISAFSNGQLTRVGPYSYCEVLNLDKCVVPAVWGELTVNSRHPVQLSVPEQIARAPWVLQLAYEDSPLAQMKWIRPNTRMTMTIATVDPNHGRLLGFAVQLLTMVRDANGNEGPVPHAEWSVRTNWN